MDSSSNNETTHDFPPFFKVFKDGLVERYMVRNHVPAGLDPKTGVHSKDVVISPETNLSARIFIPKIDRHDKKLPLIVHCHGGGFCAGSPFDWVAQNFLTALVTKANVMAISVDYRLAPEHPLPIAYDDFWTALQWIATHSPGNGTEQWINEHADLGRVFLAGESAGANIAHHVAVRAGSSGLAGVTISGLLMIHPFFGGKEIDKMYQYLCPTSSGGDDDPKLNPKVDPNLAKLGCRKVLVCVAEKDWLRDRGVGYYETVGKSGWSGAIEFYESKGEDHCFHMFNTNSENGVALINKMVGFIRAY